MPVMTRGLPPPWEKGRYAIFGAKREAEGADLSCDKVVDLASEAIERGWLSMTEP